MFVESIDEMSSGKALADQMMCNVLECSPNLSSQCLNVRTVRIIQVNMNDRSGPKGFRKRIQSLAMIVLSLEFVHQSMSYLWL